MEKMTVAAAMRKFGSLYHIAKLCDVNKSTAGRWQRYVPERYVPILANTPRKHLVRGGNRNV